MLHCVNKKFNLFSPFLHPLSQLSTWGFPWSMNYRKGSNEHSLARSLKYQPCKNQNLGGNFLAVKSCASSSVGWGLEREHNGLKSFIFLSCKTEVNKVLNAPSEMISLNWKMHGVAVNTPCLYMDLDGRKNYPLLIYSSRRSKFIRNPKQTWFLNSYEGFLTLYCPIHVDTFTLISNLATDYIQKRRWEPGLFSFEYNLLPKLISM